MKQITRGVQELDSKGLIDTVEEIKNGGPDSQQKDLSSQLQWRRQFLDGKSDLNKTLNPNVVAAADYMSVGVCITP